MTDTEEPTRIRRLASLACVTRSQRTRPSLLRRFPPLSEKWTRCAQIAIALLALVLYSLNNSLYKFLTHIFVSQYRYPYVVQLNFAQVVLTLLTLASLRTVGILPLAPYSLQLGEQLLVPSICEAAWAVLDLWVRGSGRAGLYDLPLHLLPLACFAWSRALGLTPLPSVRIAALLAVVALVSVTITVTHGPLWADPLMCLYGPVSLLLHSVSLCWLAKVGDQEKGRRGRHTTPLDLCFSLTINKSLVLGFLCLLHPDGASVMSTGSWHSLLFLAYLLGVLLLGSVQRLLLDVAVLHCSPLIASLLYSVQGLAGPLTGLL